jgi:hypothetical protein
MENERSDDQQEQAQGQDESVEEFKQEVEEDPSTAQSPDEDAEQLRGG